MNRNPYLILRRCRDATILQLRQLFSPANNTAVPNFQYAYVESAATGYIQFYGNPVLNDTLTIGTNIITFGVTVVIGATQQITLANLVAYINANSSTLLVTATTNSIPNQINLMAVTTGISGNSITLVVSSKVLRVSAPTLTQGGLFDFDNSDVFISDAIPQDYQDWPCIIVDTAMANEIRYLDNEGNFEAKNSANVVTNSEIFSSLVVTIVIKIYSIDDTLARDNIADLIYNNLSEIRDVLAVNGIEMIDRTLPNETRLSQNQRIYIENPFILRVYCEWSDSLTPIVNVSSIGVSVPVYTNAVPIINSPLSAFYNHGVQFIVDSVVDSTHLAIESANGLSNGDTIVQGANTTAIISVVDNNHLQVGSTTGWIAGNATDTSANLPFNYVISASNSPTSYSATGLPTGLSVDASNGLISGIPTQLGTFYVTVNAFNAAGEGSGSLTLTVS
jgi:hypothetical protein